MGIPLLWKPLIMCSLVHAAHGIWVNQKVGGRLCRKGRSKTNWETQGKLGMSSMGRIG